MPSTAAQLCMDHAALAGGGVKNVSLFAEGFSEASTAGFKHSNSTGSVDHNQCS